MFKFKTFIGRTHESWEHLTIFTDEETLQNVYEVDSCGRKEISLVKNRFYSNDTAWNKASIFSLLSYALF